MILGLKIEKWRILEGGYPLTNEYHNRHGILKEAMLIAKMILNLYNFQK